MLVYNTSLFYIFCIFFAWFYLEIYHCFGRTYANSKSGKSTGHKTGGNFHCKNTVKCYTVLVKITFFLLQLGLGTVPFALTPSVMSIIR